MQANLGAKKDFGHLSFFTLQMVMLEFFSTFLATSKHNCEEIVVVVLQGRNVRIPYLVIDNGCLMLNCSFYMVRNLGWGKCTAKKTTNTILVWITIKS